MNQIQQAAVHHNAYVERLREGTYDEESIVALAHVCELARDPATSDGSIDPDVFDVMSAFVDLSRLMAGHYRDPANRDNIVALGKKMVLFPCCSVE